MTQTRQGDLDRLAADPSDQRLVCLALTAAAREIAFLRAHAAAAVQGPVRPLFPGPDPAPGWQPSTPPPGTRSITKTYRDRLIWAGTTPEQAFRLERACLSRLERTAGAAHFPVVVEQDADTPSLSITHAGFDLRALVARGRPVALRDAEGQIARILDALDQAGVVHLDLHPDGRNLCVGDDGDLRLIDFDIAALEGQVFSGAMAERLAELASGGDLRQAMGQRLSGMLDRCPLLRRP